MLENSILGKLYTYWQYSLLYAILAKIYHVFSNAFKYSLTASIGRRDSKLQLWYENCLISKIIDAIINFVLRIIGAVCNFLAPAWENSKIVSWCKGSVFLKFDFLLNAFICGMFIMPHEYWSNFFAVLGSVGLMAIYIVMCGVNSRKLLYPKKLGLPLLIFAALTPISMLYTEDFSNSFRILLFFMAAFLFMWLVASNVDTKERLHVILGWIYIVVIFTACYAIMQRAMGLEANPTFIDEVLNPNMPARVYSTVENPNNYAELVVLFTPLATVFAMNVKDMFKRLVAVCLLGLPLIALVMTYSRSGWMSIALTVVIFVYFTDKRLIPWIFVAGMLCLPFLPASVITRLGNLVNVSDKSASFRIQLWQSCVRLLRMDHRWLTGIGLGPYTYNHNLVLVASREIAEGMPHTQMLYMDLIMEWGIFGFISFMWFIITKLIVATRSIYSAQDKYVKGSLIAAVSSFLGIAILSIFEYIWFYPRILFAYFILLGLMIACIGMAKEGK